MADLPERLPPAPILGLDGLNVVREQVGQADGQPVSAGADSGGEDASAVGVGDPASLAHVEPGIVDHLHVDHGVTGAGHEDSVPEGTEAQAWTTRSGQPKVKRPFGADPKAIKRGVASHKRKKHPKPGQPKKWDETCTRVHVMLDARTRQILRTWDKLHSTPRLTRTARRYEGFSEAIRSICERLAAPHNVRTIERKLKGDWWKWNKSQK